MVIIKELQAMIVTAKPEAQGIIKMLSDFGSIWLKATSVEQRGLLKKMFLAIYFDGEAVIHHAFVNAPFDKLMN
jgi:hypothetical protein